MNGHLAEFNVIKLEMIIIFAFAEKFLNLVDPSLLRNFEGIKIINNHESIFSLSYRAGGIIFPIFHIWYWRKIEFCLLTHVQNYLNQKNIFSSVLVLVYKDREKVQNPWSSLEYLEGKLAKNLIWRILMPWSVPKRNLLYWFTKLWQTFFDNSFLLFSTIDWCHINRIVNFKNT